MLPPLRFKRNAEQQGLRRFVRNQTLASTSTHPKDLGSDDHASILKHLPSGSKVWERPVTDAILAWYIANRAGKDQPDPPYEKVPVIDEAAFHSLYTALVQNGELPLPTDLAEAIEYTTPPQPEGYMPWILDMCVRMTDMRNQLIELIHSLPRKDWVHVNGSLPNTLRDGAPRSTTIVESADAGNPNARLILYDKDVMIAAVSHDSTILKYANNRFPYERFTDDPEVIAAATSGLQYASERLKNDKQTVLNAVSKSGANLEHASDILKRDEEVVMAAVLNFGFALEWASYLLKDDEEIVRAAMRNFPSTFKYASFRLKDDDQFVLAFLNDVPKNLDEDKLYKYRYDRGLAFQYASERVRDIRDVVLAAVSICGEALLWASYDFKSDDEVVRAGTKNNGLALVYADYEFRLNYDLAYDAAESYGPILEYLNLDFRNDFNLVLRAVTNFAEGLEFASEELQGNPQIVLAALNASIRDNTEETVFQLASNALKKDRDFVLSAVKIDARAIEFADETVQADKEIAIAAITSTPQMFEYLPIGLKDDKQIAKLAVSHWGPMLKFVSERLKFDHDVVTMAVKLKHPDTFDHVPERLQYDPEIRRMAGFDGDVLRDAPMWIKNDQEAVLAAVTDRGEELEYAHERLRGDKEVVKEAVKNSPDSIEFASESLQTDPEIQQLIALVAGAKMKD